MSVPDAAVEAAARMIDAPSEPAAQEIARAALEAAAPHLMAAAWLEGYCAGEIDGSLGLNGHEPPDCRNPYRRPAA